MEVKIVKHTNIDNNRVEFLFVNFDYIYRNDLVAKLFNKLFDMDIGDKIDGFWYTIIPLRREGLIYKLVWYEEDGNSIYSENQDVKVINNLEKMLVIIVKKLNQMLQNK
jgi:uncharacterized protein YbcV (DUF1398 family)